ncbi:MAG: hypothetical protein HW394_384, partial [Acidobacteria bacterium]|nr:hypothetical protein [Acidobacteriota bacterium]
MKKILAIVVALAALFSVVPRAQDAKTSIDAAA